MSLGLIACLGAFRMIFHEEGDLYVILIENNRLAELLTMYLSGLLGLGVLQYIIQFGQNEIYKIYKDRNQMI